MHAYMFLFIVHAILHAYPLYSMFTRAVRAPARFTPTLRATIARSPYGQPKKPVPTQTPTITKRTLYTPLRLKNLYEPLTQQAKSVSLVHGAAKYTSGSLQRMYASESDAPSVQLVKELFHQQGPQFKPTANKSKAAYSLNASILGLILGACETNKLNDPKVRQFIVEQWQAEHVQVTNGSSLSLTKINNLLLLIEKTYKEDTNTGRSILLAFLYAKADPSSDHDMIHYLASLNQFMPIFKNPHHQNQLESKKSNTQKNDTTFLSRLMVTIQSMKDYFMGKKDVYTAQEHAAMRATLVSPPKDGENKLESILKENFEQAIATILIEKQTSSTFPPKVIQSYFGYKAKFPAPDCAETAIHDFLNCLLYNQQTQSFDLSLLPKSVVLNNAFRDFYTQYNGVNTVNNTENGQAFMNLISAIPEVNYVRIDYELKADNTIHNLPIIINHFLGTHAHDLQELGQVLSDENRTVTCNLEKASVEVNEIVITIHTKQNDLMQQVRLCFKRGHSWLEIPQREAKSTQRYLIDPMAIANQYSLSQEAQSLFSIQSYVHAVSETTDTPTASIYYSLSAETDSGKFEIIRAISRQSAQNKEATDYAYTLYKNMLPHNQMHIVNDIYHIAQFNPKFNNVYTIIKPENEKQKISLMQNILKHASANPEAVEYAYTLFDTEPIGTQLSQLLGAVLESNVWETNKNFEHFCLRYLRWTIPTAQLFGLLTTDFVQKIYTKLPSDEAKKDFLSTVLSRVHDQNITYGSKTDLISIVNTLITMGCDPNAQTTKTHLTPLFAAIKLNDVPLVELLIQHGARVDQVKEVSMNQASNWSRDRSLPEQQTAVNFAIIAGSSNEIKTLIKHGANPNMTNALGEHPATLTPLILAAQITRLSHRVPVEMAKALLENGADPNLGITVNGKLITPLFAAVDNRSPEIVEVLIQHGVNLNTVDENGITALERAIYDNDHPKKDDTSFTVWDAKMHSPNLEKIIQLLTDASTKTNDTK
jgi:ankyrin repeat protein